MPTPVTTHPTDAALAEFVLGKLPDADDAAVGAHLAECPECQDRAAAAQPADTLVSLLAAAGTRADAGHTVPPVPASEATPADFAQTRAWDAGVRPELGTAGADDAVPEGLAHHPRYRLVRLLGSGGMGVVWLAEHTVMGRPVALKVIRPAFLARAGAVERFRREVRAAAQLNHPNIATAYDADEAGGSHFLVMEYVNGEVLLDVVRRGPLPVAAACRAVRDAARGLAHAHAAGLIHRDVKPANLIRAADGTVKVLDFGLVGMEAGAVELTGANVVMGTPDYIAPEQATDARTADARSDVYALGCTLYHLLAGRVPFPGGTTLQKLDAHRDPARAPDPVAGVSAKLARVLARMTAKDPAARYQTAEAAADALDRFCVTLEEEAQPVAVVGARPRSRRRLAVAAGVLFALAAVAAGGVVYKVQRDNQTITIETDDPDIEVVMRRNGDLVRIVDTKTKQVWELDAKKMRLKPEGGELSIDLPGKEPLVIRRNGDVVVTVARHPKPTSVIPPIPPAPEISLVCKIPFTFAGCHDFTEDGKQFLATTVEKGQKIAVIFDTATGRELERCPMPTATFLGVYFLPNTTDLLVSADGKLSRWDRKTGKKVADLFTLPQLNVALMRLSVDGKRLPTYFGDVLGPGRGIVVVYDLETKKEAYRINPVNNATVMCMAPAFSPDGKYLATLDSHPSGSQLRLWDAVTGKLVRSIEAPGAFQVRVVFRNGSDEVTADYFDPARKQLVVGTWKTKTGDPVRKTAVDLSNPDAGIAILPQSDLGYGLSPKGALRFWDLRTGKWETDFGDHGSLVSAAFSPTGGHLLVVGHAGLDLLRLPLATGSVP